MKVIEIFDSIDGEGIRTGQCAALISNLFFTSYIFSSPYIVRNRVF